MCRLFVLIAAFSALLPADWKDPSPHNTSFISVDNDVRLEVLDWGGSGRALVLLAGMANRFCRTSGICWIWQDGAIR